MDFVPPVHLRRAVAAHSAYWPCLVAGQYSVDPFSQRDRLQGICDGMVEDGKRPLIVDASANIEMSALRYAKHYPASRIPEIEPNLENYELLVKQDQIVPFHGGIGFRDTGLTIENGEGGAQHFRTWQVPSDTPGALQAITVDTILERTGSTSLFIAKIDIEAEQYACLRGNTDWISKTHLIVIELDDGQFPWAATSRPFLSCVSKYPFDYLLHAEDVFCIRDLGVAEEGMS